MTNQSSSKSNRGKESTDVRAPLVVNNDADLDSSDYVRELDRLQRELAKVQQWITNTGQRVVVLFEGRDAAGKGGVIKRIIKHLNPRVCRVVALGKPSDREKSQWYFQRYVHHLPAAGEMVLFDRSWYNRAGVERVMGFCTEQECSEFLRACPEFERMLIRSGITLIKYWFSVSAREQEKRFQARLNNPLKQWKLSPVDLQSRLMWTEYSDAKDEMFTCTDTDESPWYIVKADRKRRARLNCISHLLSLLSYEHTEFKVPKLPPRELDVSSETTPEINQRLVPNRY